MARKPATGKRLFIAAALGLVVGSPVSLALAHGYIDKTIPRAGERLTTIPTAVCIWYTEPIEKGFSSFSVKNSKGIRVDDEQQQKKAKDRFGTTKTIAIPLKRLEPGTYTVEWKVLSVDSHVTEGKFTFTVLPGAKPRADQAQKAGEAASPCTEPSGSQ